MAWPFYPYLSGNSTLKPSYIPQGTGEATHPFYPPWYQPSGGTGMSPYQPGEAVAPGGIGPPATPPGGGMLAAPAGEPGVPSTTGVQPRNFGSDLYNLGVGLRNVLKGSLPRALTSEIPTLFGSPQGDPDVKKQIEEQYAAHGLTDPFPFAASSAQASQPIEPGSFAWDMGTPQAQTQPVAQTQPLMPSSFSWDTSGQQQPPTQPAQQSVPMPPERPMIPQAAPPAPMPAQRYEELLNKPAPQAAPAQNPQTNPYGFADSPAYMGQGSTPGNLSMIINSLMGK